MTNIPAPYHIFTQENAELAARIQGIVDRGRVHLEHGNKEEARKDFLHALSLYPHVPAALNNLALLAYADGESERARAYLEVLLGYDEKETTANALMARYWWETGAYPLATKYASLAVQSVLILARQPQAEDPSSMRRALQFTYQALILLEFNAEMVRIYELIPNQTLLPPTLAHIGLAYFNIGFFDKASGLWQQAVEQGYDPAQVFLDMKEIIDIHNLLPFRLDHMLEMPQPEKGRHIWFSHVPTVFSAAALTRVYRSSASEAEEALTLLVQAGLPGLELILQQVAMDLTRPAKLRLLACLHLFAAGAVEKASRFVIGVDGEKLVGEELALWALVRGLIAESEDQKEQAAKLAQQGLSAVPAQEASGPAVRAMLEALASRCGVSPQPPIKDELSTGDDETSQSELPDADWLRQALQGMVSATLEESLARRSRLMVEELAHRLGETQPSHMSAEALVRRLAVRMRSLQLEKVLRPLQSHIRQLLSWLAKAEQPIPVFKVEQKLAEEWPHTDLWSVMEALYRSGLIDIGFTQQQTGESLDSDEVVVVVPADLQGHLASLEA